MLKIQGIYCEHQKNPATVETDQPGFWNLIMPTYIRKPGGFRYGRMEVMEKSLRGTVRKEKVDGQ